MPLMRGIVKGIDFGLFSRYPRWMYHYHFIMDEVAISPDGKQHFPKKLTPTQEWKLEEARRVIAYYARKP